MSTGRVPSRPQPRIDPSAYLAPGVWILGDVRVGPQASVWFGSVLRGDLHFIEVGAATNIQDLCVLHVTEEYPCRVGAGVTVGHRAILHGCVVEDRCLIGMGAIVLDGAVIGEGSVVGAGCVVTEGSQIPPGSLVLGVPGRVRRSLAARESPAEALASDYLGYAREHREGKFPLYQAPKRKGCQR